MSLVRVLDPLRHAAVACSLDHGGVVSRRELAALGIDHRMIAREVSAGRWKVHGRHTVAIHTGRLDAEATWWRAVWEVGEQVAVVDGVTAQQAAGLTGFHDDTVHISVSHRVALRSYAGLRVHKVIRRVPAELVTSGLPRARPAVAAVRAAHWAVSDRQAALVLAMPVQQRLTTGAQLLATVDAIPGRNRRRLIRLLAQDIADGAQSLGELDFAALCRQRGLPDPRRQVVRREPTGRIYLDARWDCGLVVEIDGSAHRMGLAVADDHLRANRVSIAGDLVLRMDLVGLRLHADAFMDQVEQAYRTCKDRHHAA